MKRTLLSLLVLFAPFGKIFAGPIEELLKSAEVAYSKGDYEKAKSLYMDITQLKDATAEQHSIAQHNINLCNTKIKVREYERSYTLAYNLFKQRKFEESRKKCIPLLSHSRYTKRTNTLIEQCTDSINKQLKIKHTADSIQYIQSLLRDEYEHLMEKANGYYNNKLYKNARKCYNLTLNSKFHDIVPQNTPKWLSRCDSIIEFQKTGGVVATPKLAKAISGAICLGDFSEGFAYVERIDSANKRQKFIINTEGDIICRAYSVLQQFHDGYLAVESDSPYGSGHFINTQGKYLDMSHLGIFIRDCDRFSEGMAPIQNEHQKWGYIDKYLNLVIKPQYDYATAFHEGLALVRKGAKWSYIDKIGKTVIKSFNPGTDNGLHGYKNRNHNSYFSNGISWIWNNKEDGCVGINKKGEIWLKGVSFGLWLVRDELYYWPHFSNGLCPYGISANFGKSLKFGFINTGGSLVIPMIYDKVYPFKDGVAMVVQDDLTGFINTKGEVVIPLTNRSFGELSFSEGLIPIKSNGLYGFLNIKNQMVITPQFKEATSFHCGLAVVKDNKGQLGYVDFFGNSTSDFE